MCADIKKLIEPHLAFTKADYVTFPKGWGDYNVQLARYQYAVNRRTKINKIFGQLEYAPDLMGKLNDFSEGAIFFHEGALYLNSAHYYAWHRYERNMRILLTTGNAILQARSVCWAA